MQKYNGEKFMLFQLARRPIVQQAETVFSIDAIKKSKPDNFLITGEGGDYVEVVVDTGSCINANAINKKK